MRQETARSLLLGGCLLIAAGVAFWATRPAGRGKGATRSSPQTESPNGSAEQPTPPLRPMAAPPPRHDLPQHRAPPTAAGAAAPSDSAPWMKLPFGEIDGGCPEDGVMSTAWGGEGCGYVSAEADGGVILNGPWSRTYPGGLTLSGQYVDGLREGPWTKKDENGHVIDQFQYLHDQNEGVEHEFDGSGNLTATRPFHHGAIDGETWVRQPNGAILREVFSNGKKMSEETTPAPASSAN